MIRVISLSEREGGEQAMDVFHLRWGQAARPRGSVGAGWPRRRSMGRAGAGVW